jgi:hypothetical protein
MTYPFSTCLNPETCVSFSLVPASRKASWSSSVKGEQYMAKWHIQPGPPEFRTELGFVYFEKPERVSCSTRRHTFLRYRRTCGIGPANVKNFLRGYHRGDGLVRAARGPGIHKDEKKYSCRHQILLIHNSNKVGRTKTNHKALGKRESMGVPVWTVHVYSQ